MNDIKSINANESIVNSNNKNLEKKIIEKKEFSNNEIEDLVSRGWITKDGGQTYTKDNVYGVANFTILT